MLTRAGPQSALTQVHCSISLPVVAPGWYGNRQFFLLKETYSPAVWSYVQCTCTFTCTYMYLVCLSRILYQLSSWPIFLLPTPLLIRYSPWRTNKIGFFLPFLSLPEIFSKMIHHNVIITMAESCWQLVFNNSSEDMRAKTRQYVCISPVPIPVQY